MPAITKIMTNLKFMINGDEIVDKIYEESLEMHKVKRGKLEIKSKVKLNDAKDLSLAYSPGVAAPCLEIVDNPEQIYDYTAKGNMVAVVTNGSAVLGLGNIGAAASLPVMEGKAVLFKEFANVDAYPVCIDSNDIDEIVRTVKLIETSFGGINLEDIAAPTCFEIERRLKQELNIPVFHDDQHGTAIVVLAGLINALKLIGKDFSQIRVVTSGAGASGTAIIKLLINYGVSDVIMCDSHGIIYQGRPNGMSPTKAELAEMTNRERLTGSLADALSGADVFIGVSVAGALTADMIATMASESIIFALANPEPEILPDVAKKAGARVIATGRSDYPNQVNNVLAFPGIFRGALDVRASDINEAMKLAAAKAIAGLITDTELNENYIIPNPFNQLVVQAVSSAVAEAAIRTGVARGGRGDE